MNPLTIVSLIGLGVTVLGVVVGIAMFVASMKANTRELGRSIDLLRITVEKLDETIAHIQQRSNDIDSRLSMIEGKLL